MDNLPSFWDHVVLAPSLRSSPTAPFYYKGLVFLGGVCDFIWAMTRKVVWIKEVDNKVTLCNNPQPDSPVYRGGKIFECFLLAGRIAAFCCLIFQGPSGWAYLAGIFAGKMAYRTYVNANYLSRLSQTVPNNNDDPSSSAMALSRVPSSNAPSTSTSIMEHIPGVSAFVKRMESKKQRDLKVMQDAINESMQLILSSLERRPQAGTAVISLQFKDEKSSATQKETIMASAFIRVDITPGSAPQIQGISATIDQRQEPLTLSDFSSNDNASTSSALASTSNLIIGFSLARLLPTRVVNTCRIIASAAIIKNSKLNDLYDVYDIMNEEREKAFSASSSCSFAEVPSKNLEAYLAAYDRTNSLLEQRHLWDPPQASFSSIVEIEDVTDTEEP